MKDPQTINEYNATVTVVKGESCLEISDFIDCSPESLDSDIQDHP
jgi:hypothetical protein